MGWAILALLVAILFVLLMIWGEVNRVVRGLMMTRDTFIVVTRDEICSRIDALRNETKQRR